MSAQLLSRNLSRRRRWPTDNGGASWRSSTYRRCWGSGLWVNAPYSNEVLA